jgi:hypothetical protein
LIDLLRAIYEKTGVSHPWRIEIGTLIDNFINNMHKINRPAEIGVLLSLMRGCDFDGIAPH